ncbi:MAG: rhomboid family intramembrane serine protease, partial [Myxococcota bacterium]
MKVWLRDAGEEYPIDLADLEESIRQGLISGDAELDHPPWTHRGFKRLRDLPPLFEAFDTPDARFADHLRRRSVTWLTGALSVIIMGYALFQSALTRSRLDWAAQTLQSTFHQWMLGLEPTLLDGRWWTPWTAQLVHGDLLHALFNLPIIAYCGYRVEQAFAASGALAVVAAAILGGAIAVVGFDESPMIGSSVIAYGLWGAQITIGLRMGDAVPREIRGRYGMGNLIFFAPLYAASLFNPDLSHLGHLGGLVGGGLVGFFLYTETMPPTTTPPRSGHGSGCGAGPPSAPS